MDASRVDLDPCPELGFDILRPIWSASAALFVTSADGRSAVSLRLCTYPDAGTGWLWTHVFTPERAWSYNVDHVSTPRTRVDVAGEDATYLAVDGTAVFSRIGPRGTPEGAEIDLTVPAHLGPEAPDHDGDIPVRLRGTFHPTAAEGGTLPGRSELLGRAEVAVDVDGHPPFIVSGAAQWHEQHQANPRFVVPFTYASLRGAGLSLIALIAPKASGGFVRGVGGDRRFTAATIPEPDGGRHPIELIAEDGGVVRGEALLRHSFTIPLYGRPWWGTIVSATVDGHATTGSINRWRFAAGTEGAAR